MINALISYKTSINIALPHWAHQPYFEDEKRLYDHITELQGKIETETQELNNFQESKKLLFLREYEFEDAVINFLGNLGLAIEREEKYKEDFWVLAENKSRVMIGEMKSYLKGAKVSAVYSVLTHKDEHELSEDFPALLISKPLHWC